jgi:hypothetical protein
MGRHLEGGVYRGLRRTGRKGVAKAPRRAVSRGVVLAAGGGLHIRDRECSGIDCGPLLIWRVEEVWKEILDS